MTNSFATKTPARLAALSANIIAVEPTVAGLAGGLLQAARRVAAAEPRTAALAMARDWADTLDPAAQRIAAIFRALSAAGAVSAPSRTTATTSAAPPPASAAW